MLILMPSLASLDLQTFMCADRCASKANVYPQGHTNHHGQLFFSVYCIVSSIYLPTFSETLLSLVMMQTARE